MNYSITRMAYLHFKAVSWLALFYIACTSIWGFYFTVSLFYFDAVMLVQTCFLFWMYLIQEALQQFSQPFFLSLFFHSIKWLLDSQAFWLQNKVLFILLSCSWNLPLCIQISEIWNLFRLLIVYLVQGTKKCLVCSSVSYNRTKRCIPILAYVDTMNS